eukprot:CAMPEP_0184982380 /NCGR_PEP_ID=MMETSP1098-20130426/11877_1 /TAXON_ID=89044 /ORGANISM="Spumella elongata, Strain CCAP 955/1" /LENGTH=191 /DNA_ID=CAMNT_0027506075 /DNA_START=61 /DNA_END=636 /DNA_ORIENTATION=+
MGNGPSKVFGESSAAIVTRAVAPNVAGKKDVATLAGGCFWGIELAFQRVPGVVKTEVGYTQGIKKNPTYEEVCSGTTGHTEAVQITYDPAAVSYDDLLTVFWDLIDPTTLNRQGGDAGTQYRSGIYYHDEDQHQVAERSVEKQQQKLSDKIVTEVLPATTWYPAEDYHQQYLSKGGQCSRTGDLTPIRCYG